MILCERLRELRTERKLTQKQCAEQLGVELSNYNKWENGISPNLETLCVIAQYFNVTTDYLLGIVNEQTNENVHIAKITKLSNEAIEALKLNTRFPEDSKYNIIKFINAILEEQYLIEKNINVNNGKIQSNQASLFADGLIRSITKYLNIQTDGRLLCIERNNKNLYLLNNELENEKPLTTLLPLEDLILQHYIDKIKQDLIELKRKYNPVEPQRGEPNVNEAE